MLAPFFLMHGPRSFPLQERDIFLRILLHYDCLVFSSLHLHIVIDSEMRDISDKPFRFVRPAYQPAISPLASIFYPSIQPSPHSVLSTDRPRNQFGVVKHKKSRNLPFHPRQVTALSPRGFEVCHEPKTSQGRGFEGPRERSCDTTSTRV